MTTSPEDISAETEQDNDILKNNELKISNYGDGPVISIIPHGDGEWSQITLNDNGNVEISNLNKKDGGNTWIDETTKVEVIPGGERPELLVGWTHVREGAKVGYGEQVKMNLQLNEAKVLDKVQTIEVLQKALASLNAIKTRLNNPDDASFQLYHKLEAKNLNPEDNNGSFNKAIQQLKNRIKLLTAQTQEAQVKTTESKSDASTDHSETRENPTKQNALKKAADALLRKQSIPEYDLRRNEQQNITAQQERADLQRTIEEEANNNGLSIEEITQKAERQKIETAKQQAIRAYTELVKTRLPSLNARFKNPVIDQVFHKRVDRHEELRNIIRNAEQLGISRDDIEKQGKEWIANQDKIRRAGKVNQMKLATGRVKELQKISWVDRSDSESDELARLEQKISSTKNHWDITQEEID